MRRIIFYYKYLYYLWLTSDDRHLYSIGKIKGYNCVGFSKGLAGRTYKYDMTSEPVRNYLTYEEFKLNHWPKKKKEHGFLPKDVMNIKIDPVCVCGCGKHLSDFN